MNWAREGRSDQEWAPSDVVACRGNLHLGLREAGTARTPSMAGDVRTETHCSPIGMMCGTSRSSLGAVGEDVAASVSTGVPQVVHIGVQQGRDQGWECRGESGIGRGRHAPYRLPHGDFGPGLLSWLRKGARTMSESLMRLTMLEVLSAMMMVPFKPAVRWGTTESTRVGGRYTKKTCWI